MEQAHGNVMKRGTHTASITHPSPDLNNVKNASVNITDIPTSDSNSSTAGSCASLLSMDEEIVDPFSVSSFDAQLAAVLGTRPILSTSSTQSTTNAAKRQRLDTISFVDISSSSSSSTALPALPKTRQPMGRPKKPVPENPPPKRPVGRPRIHPKKELDPNRQRRVAKGDKPLGRPRTRPPTPPDFVKRPRGRPRKIPVDAVDAVKGVDGVALPIMSESPSAGSDAQTRASSVVAGSHVNTRSHDSPKDSSIGGAVDTSASSRRTSVRSAGLTPPTVNTTITNGTASSEASEGSAARSSRTEHGVRHSARLTPPTASAATLPVAPNSNSSSGNSKSDVSVKSVLSKRRYA